MERLDKFLLDKGLVPTRSRAQDHIRSGKVFVNNEKVTKPGFKVSEQDKIELKDAHDYVGRGALKIKKAIEEFRISVDGKTIADVGASTGGFTDYLLRSGAWKSYCIDVGHDQLAKELIEDERVVNLEGTNIKTAGDLDISADLIVVDLSFISVKNIFEHITKLAKDEAQIVVLFKPQFEVGKDRVGKNGIVKDRKVYRDILLEFKQSIATHGYHINNACFSPIEGKSGNKEFLLLLERQSKDFGLENFIGSFL